MQTNHFKSILKSARVLAILPFAAIAAFGQQTINLTAAPTTTTLPDGNVVPMWGYSCGLAATGATATCAALNPASAATLTTAATWSPVVITVPVATSGLTSLTINLTNNLSFTPTGATTANAVPTSIMIVGQVGGGLGSARTTTASPDHSLVQGCGTWFIASGATPPGTPCPAPQPGASGTPPVQGPRVQSLATEVAGGATTALTWPALAPGTYLLESGTHPSIQVPMGLIGVLVVTAAPAGTTAGTAYPAAGTVPAVTYNAEIPLEFSEIDPVQNKAVNTAVSTAGFSETRVWSGLIGKCGNASSPVGVVNTCYPPVVNYTPFYYLINGVAFNKTNATASLFAASSGGVTTGITGTVLVRMVNAGLRMHVPAIVGSLTQGFNGAGAAATVSGFTLIAEDGNVVPGVVGSGTGTAPAPRVQTDVFMAAGKVFDVMINAPAAGSTAPALPVYDRELSLSGNSSVRDAGMLAYIGVNSAGLPVAAGSGAFSAAVARADVYNGLAAGQVLSVTDPSKGVIANDTNVYGVTLLTAPTSGTLTCTAQPQTSVAGICANGTFTYTPTGTGTSDTFTYCANGSVTAATCSSGLTATVTLGASTLSGNPTAVTQSYTAKVATYLKIPSPGLLLGNSDPNNLPLTVVPSSSTTVVIDQDGGFNISGTAGSTSTFAYTVRNSQGRLATGTASVVFPTPSNLQVRVLDAQLYNNCGGNSACISGLSPLTDYRWIIEEDQTYYVDPNCTTNSSITTPGCPAVVGPSGTSTIPTFGVNFHTSAMNFVAQGCTGKQSCEGGQTMYDATSGQHVPAVCDLGNGACRPDPTGNGYTAVLPSAVHLDPSKRYYISVLPGDAANPFPAYTGTPDCPTGGNSTTGTCGHAMSGAPVPAACNILGGPNACTATSTFTNPVNVLVLPTPFPTGRLSIIVFEDDFPLNGEQDGGGGNGTVAPIEPGLGGFNIVLWDTYGGLGDVTGQNSNDMFNQPLSNSLAGTTDPVTGLDACPVSATPLSGPGGSGPAPATGITGMIVTCPKYESDGHTLSPLAGQVVVANLMPDKFSVQAYPGADRIARGEEWLQTNTLDGQHPHDSFIRIGEPSYFQEYGPAGYHVAIGFANPAIINARRAAVCAGAGSPGAVGPCNNTISGTVNMQRLSRIPDERLYPSGSHDALAWTQSWVSLGDPDGEDFMFVKCDSNGNFKFTGVPGGSWRLTIGDQWNDQIIDGLSTPANVGCVPTPPATACPAGTVTNLAMGNIGVQQWQSNVYTRTFVDDNKNGIWDPGEIGIPLLYTMIHYRDGHTANNLLTDFDGVANFNEEFPLFNWYVVEADSTRYKTTGIHTVYDAGGPADGTTYCGANGARACGTSTAYTTMANTFEAIPLPADLSVPGSVYCAKADCSAEAAGFAAGTAKPSFSTASTGRIDPPWVFAEGWAGLTGQGNWIEFGKAPYASCPPACATVPNPLYNPTAGGTTASTIQVPENGGIHGLVVYAATRPFDDASYMIQQPWAPNIPHVTVNLYQEGFAADGVTPTLKLVDTTQTSSWDDWAQGFYPGSTAGSASGAGQKPYMNCPGEGTNVAGTPNQDLFYFTLFDQPNYLDWYNSIHNGGTLHTLPYNSQFKCYDSMKINNQVQPAPYDGKYFFPSSLGVNPTTGKPVTTVGSTNGVAANMPGTNCTVCVANPDSTDKYRFGTPMLPPGKYVTEVIMPAGYEVYKEEDKNLLIGDNYIAPVTQQFGGLGTDIFIMPDQASVASMYDQSGAGYNPNNYQNQTTAEGNSDTLALPGFPGFVDPIWPCVGEMRVVPDYLSLFPQALETAPFAGATRPLCDRKEVTLTSQMSVSAKFYIYTSTHIAAKYTGVITDDLTSEFDPFSPQFGEKFAPPNLPISTKDYLGNETSRVYSDHWGIYNGLTFSTWDVDPPNITGYSPQMMTQCMNDPGPILDTRTTIPNPTGTGTITNPTFGQLIQDPLYNPAYSDFCYEEPYMPGLTAYLDTPVVPTQAFVGAGYNNVDCAYPDATPALKEVDGDAIGPWVSAAGKTLTITALGNVTVNNSAYSGPSANVAPFNMKTITRHYGFGGTQGTGSVTIGGVKATVGSWSDTAITVTVPAGVPNCAIQQQAQYGGSTAQCGQLVIMAGNGKQSVDAVTVTIGGKAPTHIAASATIQSAIDAAAPGDLLMVDPTCTSGSGAATTIVPCTTAGAGKAVAAHSEMLLMWKPVRLQGVGAASSIIDANANPSGKLLDPWRRHVNCLFGLTMNGVPVGTASATGGTAVYDPNGQYSCPDAGWNYYVGQTNVPQIDRVPLEAVVGWDATVNGNLAEQLQEPSLMGAYEGAGITVLGKGVWVSPGESPWTDGSEGGAYPADALLLQNVPATLDDEGAPLGPQYSYCTTPGTATELVPNPYPSNYECNPSSIDGLTIRDASQGGGGIFVHGWAHNLQIANNQVYNNVGTLSGGISVGQGEFPIAITVVLQEGAAAGGPTGQFVADAPPSCQDSLVLGTHLPYCLDVNVNVHNNYIVSNSSLGDELFSGTLSGGGGVTFCTGSDYYKFQYNWVCGNQSSGEGGGVVHLGFIYNGDIEHNSILLNQSNNPTIPTNGGGIQVMGTPDTDPVCGTQIDADCPPGLSDGTGPGLVINANLIQGNMAESGSGGGIRLQQVNGTDVSTFPKTPASWNSVSITNNIIVNNVVGWDGGGISLQDSLNVSIINNTISSNDSLASSGVLTQSIGTPEASAPAGNCVQAGNTTSCPQSSGVTSIQNSTLLTTTFTGLTITCPAGQSATGCRGFSNPLLQNNVIWQNRAFKIGVGALGTGTLNQQKLVTLFDGISGAAAPVQTAYGQCTTGVSYWDIGVRGDTGPGNHASGFTLSPTFSLITSTTGYASSNHATAPGFVSQYCNGSRVPPTCTAADGCGGPNGYGVPPGIADSLTPNPVFSLTPAATVDEGNNWINVSWGPLSLSDDSVAGGANGNYGGGAAFANYAPLASFDGTAAAIPVSQPHPTLDFFGNARPEPGDTAFFDPGAIEVQGAGGGGGGAVLSVTGGPLAFGNQAVGTTSAARTLTMHNTGTAAGTGIALTFSSARFSRPAGAAGGTCTATLAAAATCTISVVFSPTAVGAVSGTLTIAANVAVTGSPVALSGTGVAPVITATLTPASHAYPAQTRSATACGTADLGCLTAPLQVFTLTNTGNVTLTGIAQAVLGGTNAVDFNVDRLVSTCGPTGGGQVAGQVTLAPGAVCVITVAFHPLTSDTAGAKAATISVTDAAGTQTSTLTGTAN
jgi:hypothetical protein